ncbi:hypothetical protein AgCh_013342 [Apium graveolens]
MMGELSYFLGLQVKQTEEGTFISQSKYTRNLLKKFGMQDSSTASTPMATVTKLDKDTGESVDNTNYRGMIGSLLYLTASRPDIMYVTCLCARFQADPREPHLIDVKRIFKYLKGIADLGLWYPRESDFKLIGNPVQHSMTKHISIKYHFIRKHVMKGTMELYFVPTDQQLPDIFTKPLCEATFARLWGPLADIEASVALQALHLLSGVAVGVRLFDTLIALLPKSKPILGIIDRPILRKRWVGVQGRPTTVDGLHIQTRSCEWLSQETLSNFRLPNSLLLRYASSPLHFNDDEREAFDHVTKKNLPNERTRGILNEEKNVTEAILDELPRRTKCTILSGLMQHFLLLPIEMAPKDVIFNGAKFVPNNYMAILSKDDAPSDLHFIQDFLARSEIMYALTQPQALSGTQILEFWRTAVYDDGSEDGSPC